jgi:hypothetical protein
VLMWVCFSDSVFVSEVLFRLLPSLILWFGFSLILKYASDWF